MTEVTPNLPHLGNFCKYCFMGTLLHENTHICPKCGSKDIFVIDGHADAYDAGSNVPYDPTIFIYIPADRYICGACGCS